MIIHDVKQGTPEWHALRLGIPTGSEFSRIITPTGKISESRHKLMDELLAERALGCPLEKFTSAAMERGSGLEEQAVASYECKRRMDAVRVGFVTNDERTIGVSPDRFLGDDELLEVKCPNPETHMRYLRAVDDRSMRKSLAQEYRPQIQGQLWICGEARIKCVTLSYYPGWPSAILEVERDEEYIADLAEAVTLFSRDLERLWLEMADRFKPATRHQEPESGEGFMTAADIEWAMNRFAPGEQQGMA